MMTYMPHTTFGTDIRVIFAVVYLTVLNERKDLVQGFESPLWLHNTFLVGPVLL